MVLKEAPRTPTPGDNSLTIPSINNMSMSDKLKAWREREKRRKDDKENRMNSSNPGMVEKETKPRPKTPLPKGGMNLPKKTTFAYKSANRKLERKAASNTPNPPPSKSKVAALAGFSQLKNLSSNISIKTNDSTKKKQAKSLSAAPRSLSSSFSKAKTTPSPVPPKPAPATSTPATGKLSAISLLRSIKKQTERRPAPPPTPAPPAPPVELVEKETEDVINELNRSVDSVEEEDLPSAIDAIESEDAYQTPMKGQETEKAEVVEKEEVEEVEVEKVEVEKVEVEKVEVEKVEVEKVEVEKVVEAEEKIKEQKEEEVGEEEEQEEEEEEKEELEEHKEPLSPSSPYPADDEKTPVRRKKVKVQEEDELTVSGNAATSEEVARLSNIAMRYREEHKAVRFLAEVLKQENQEKSAKLIHMEERMKKEVTRIVLRHEQEVEHMRQEYAETEQMITSLTTSLKMGLQQAIDKNKALQAELDEERKARQELEEAISKSGGL